MAAPNVYMYSNVLQVFINVTKLLFHFVKIYNYFWHILFKNMRYTFFLTLNTVYLWISLQTGQVRFYLISLCLVRFQRQICMIC